MTDYTKLIERLRNPQWDERGEKLRREATDALEALQAKNERLTVERDTNKRMRDLHFTEKNALQAKLDELQRQEPVGYFKRSGFGLWWNMSPAEQDIQGVVPLYAAPKALAPLTKDRIEQIRLELCDVYILGALTAIAMTRAVERSHGIGGTP